MIPANHTRPRRCRSTVNLQHTQKGAGNTQRKLSNSHTILQRVRGSLCLVLSLEAWRGCIEFLFLCIYYFFHFFTKTDCSVELEKTGPIEALPTVDPASLVLSHISESLWWVISPPGTYPRAVTTTQSESQAICPGFMNVFYDIIVMLLFFVKNWIQLKCPTIGKCAPCALCMGEDNCDHGNPVLKYLRRWRHVYNIPIANFQRSKRQHGVGSVLSFKDMWKLGAE